MSVSSALKLTLLFIHNQNNIKIWNYTNYQYIWFPNLLFEKGSHRYYLPQPNNPTKSCRNFFVVGVIEILVTFLGERKEETAISLKGCRGQAWVDFAFSKLQGTVWTT